MQPHENFNIAYTRQHWTEQHFYFLLFRLFFSLFLSFSTSLYSCLSFNCIDQLNNICVSCESAQDSYERTPVAPRCALTQRERAPNVMCTACICRWIHAACLQYTYKLETVPCRIEPNDRVYDTSSLSLSLSRIENSTSREKHIYFQVYWHR